MICSTDLLYFLEGMCSLQPAMYYFRGSNLLRQLSRILNSEAFSSNGRPETSFMLPSSGKRAHTTSSSETSQTSSATAKPKVNHSKHQDSHSHRDEQTKSFVVLVEGNIGCGKTTMLNYFAQFKDVARVLPEPVDKWRNMRGHNLLDFIYSDPSSNSFLFQSYVFLTMLDQEVQLRRQQQKVEVGQVCLMERSLHSAWNIFVKNLHDNGLMSGAEYTVLEEIYKEMCLNFDLTPDLIIYLRVTPDVAYERIMNRGRSEESGISLQMLETLHELHEKWLNPAGENLKLNVLQKLKLGGCSGDAKIPILILDANRNCDGMVDQFLEHKDIILNGRATSILTENAPTYKDEEKVSDRKPVKALEVDVDDLMGPPGV